MMSTPMALVGARDDRPNQLINFQIVAARIATPGTVQHKMVPNQPEPIHEQ